MRDPEGKGSAASELVPGSPPPQDRDGWSSRPNTALRLPTRIPVWNPVSRRRLRAPEFRPCEWPRGYPSGTKCATTNDADGILAD